ncbi:MAG: papain-like cysteine protease family protein [Candidatus Eremiobacteraeota bacterium]|nr:papain-like cysteine protease family protein [Candidatus Eremiobacteraeota bacterium]
MNIEGLQSIQNRIGQIQSMVHGRVSSINSKLSSVPLNFQDVLNMKLGEPGPSSTSPAGTVDGVSNLKCLAQNNSISCGQTSVAMAVNSLTGKNLVDSDIDAKYGFGLLQALNGESQGAGITWRDGGTVSAGAWSLIEQKVNNEKMPVIVALNGPEFSPSGRGHIVTITKVEGDTVTFADPASGTMKTTTKDAMNNAPSHPDGNFIFYGSREGIPLPPAAMNFNPLSMLSQMNQYK